MVTVSVIYAILTMILKLVLLVVLLTILTKVIHLLDRLDSSMAMRVKMQAMFADELVEIIPSLKEIARHYAGKTTDGIADSENNTKS